VAATLTTLDRVVQKAHAVQAEAGTRVDEEHAAQTSTATAAAAAAAAAFGEEVDAGHIAQGQALAAQAGATAHHHASTRALTLDHRIGRSRPRGAHQARQHRGAQQLG